MNDQTGKTARKRRGTSPASKEKKLKGKILAEHPLAVLSGSFKDDPLWDEFIDAMSLARIEEDVKVDVSG
jgi:hypothetical protein